ncbi:alpha/beta hydrolase [Corynebacterium diphtheriae]|nr:alpha/beta hydrolase [Corynebacterium diphtheriae]CAB0948921.1 alpha/beta hydrolase [Corynebacterium diphtheriae]CAB0983626.1 alpha/beta hydrolase [Corynebacterium diphtheriae]CAB0997640.1 alpha/beta hydrolase [Corynebacterium diphtheriae]
MAAFFRRSNHSPKVPPVPISPHVVELDGPFSHIMLHTRGVRLHAATAGDPTNPLIVLLHDSFGGWFDFKECLAPLAAAGFHVAAIDFRGYGLSDKPPTGYDHYLATGDIAGSIRTLGHESAHVIACGSGAAIAWLLAANYPRHVASLTTMGAIHPLDMRRAIIGRPWLFTYPVSMTTMFRLPRVLSKRLWRLKDMWVERDLRRWTSLSFQASPEFADTLALRRLAMSIDSTFPAVAKTSRYVVNVPPLKWASQHVTAPTHVLVDATPYARYLARRAASRCTGDFDTFSIPSTRMRPHLEDPAAFVAQVLKLL